MNDKEWKNLADEYVSQVKEREPENRWPYYKGILEKALNGDSKASIEIALFWGDHHAEEKKKWLEIAAYQQNNADAYYMLGEWYFWETCSQYEFVLKPEWRDDFSTDNPCDKSHYENWPFEIPENWTWCRVDDFAYVASGSTPSKDAFVEKGIPYIKMYNLRNQQIDFFFHPQYIKPEVHNGKLQRSRTEVGDLIMNIVGPPLGKLAIIPSDLPESNFNQAAVLIRPYMYKEILVNYLFYYLSEMSEINSISTKGSAGQVNISLTQSQNMRIALPPLNEQVRIVKEVRKWFTYVDSIDSNACELEELIDNTKQSILRMAIQGKLVKQNPSDEPAIDLLKRINPNIQIPCDNPHYPFDIPQSWCWIKLGALCSFLSRGKSPKYSEERKYPVFAQKCNLYNGDISLEQARFLDPSTLSKWDDIYKLREGDVLMNSTGTGTVGRTRVFHSDCLGTYPFAVPDSHVSVIRTFDSIESKYIHAYLSSKGTQRYLEDNLAGSTNQKELYIGVLDNLLIPLPPQNEQKRIVEEIDRYFNTLDKIKESLTA